jgi:hypothetical protein
MRRHLTILIFLIIHGSLFGQKSLEETCIDSIIAHSRKVKFEKFPKEVLQKGGTFTYEYSVIKLGDPNPVALMILTSGLINPRLILSASTDGKHAFTTVDKRVVSLLTISNITELKCNHAEPHTKTFSFLVWRPGMANPYQYLFQLTNNTSDENLDMESFIKGARLTAFGFCTILI